MVVYLESDTQMCINLLLFFMLIINYNHYD